MPDQDRAGAAAHFESDECTDELADLTAACLQAGTASAAAEAASTSSSRDTELDELCPTGASDRDGDQLCDAAEARLRTDPDKPDTDEDHLRDGAEVSGILVQGAGANGEPQRLDLRALGANPLHKDIFVEVDYYEGLRPSPSAIQLVVDAFEVSPVRNPDGSDGIALHVLVDDEIGGDLALPSLGDEGKEDESEDAFPTDVYRDFKAIKDAYANPARHAAYHYAVFANTIRGTKGTGVSFQINGHDFAVTLGHEEHPSDLQIAGTFMHELGHNLGLYHGGAQQLHLAPNYLSVMNYLYQQTGVVRKPHSLYHEGDVPLEPGYEAVVDYSRLRVAAISEFEVNESQGLQPGTGTREAELDAYGVRHCAFRQKVQYNPTKGVDFDLNDEISTDVYDQDLNCDNKGERFPESQNDWEVLTFDGRGSIGNERSWEEYRAGTYALATQALCIPPVESSDQQP